MDDPGDRVYRKTDRGMGEVKSRSGGLSARSRTALILVNGVDSLAALRAKIGPDADALVEALAADGHVEPVAPPLRRGADGLGAQPLPVDIAVESIVPSAFEASAAEVRERLAPLRREALARLAPHYGPDAAVVAGPLLQAANIEAYCAALAALETKVSVYMGRKQAVKLLAGLKPD
ncbi:MAG: hypothetical protein Q8L12_08040 [Methylibium sp.]|uniref:hypothetical protein n=1 Tax=Methylibium sp. TaxID=2067992 RepID=UPI00274534DD|nr:hypothetical protein [Methylibium sp.]